MSKRDTLRTLYGELLEAVRRAADAMTPEELEQLAAGVHTCGRCQKERSDAERKGEHPLPELREVESWAGWNGRIYRAGLCFEHACEEWSRGWDGKYEKAKTDAERKALEDLIDLRLKAGRAYVGKRGTIAATRQAHSPGCRCEECRAEAVAAAMAGGGR